MSTARTVEQETAWNAWIDELLSTPEELHVTGSLSYTTDDGTLHWCAVGLANKLDYSLLANVYAGDAYQAVIWMLGGTSGAEIVQTEIVEDNDGRGYDRATNGTRLTFRQIAEKAKAGEYDWLRDAHDTARTYREYHWFCIDEYYGCD